MDQGRFPELYEAVSLDQVADAWLVHLREPTEVGKDRFWWAVQFLYDDPDVQRRRSILLLLIEKAAMTSSWGRWRRPVGGAPVRG